MGLRVLLVDDMPMMREMVRSMLSREGCEIVGEARDGQEGLDMFKTYAPDLVLMDINMPVLNGIEAIDRIRELDQEAKIIVCSGINDQEMIEKAKDHGAKDYIVKPFSKHRLVDAIRKIS